MSTSIQPRDLAASMLQQGMSPAHVWEALVSSGVDGTVAEALVREHLDPSGQAGGPTPPTGDMVTLPVAQILGWDEADRGELWKGFLLGTFLGCTAFIVALLAHGTMGSETRKGVYMGFALNVSLSFVFALLRQ